MLFFTLRRELPLPLRISFRVFSLFRGLLLSLVSLLFVRELGSLPDPVLDDLCVFSVFSVLAAAGSANINDAELLCDGARPMSSAGLVALEWQASADQCRQKSRLCIQSRTAQTVASLGRGMIDYRASGGQRSAALCEDCRTVGMIG